MVTRNLNYEIIRLFYGCKEQTDGLNLSVMSFL